MILIDENGKPRGKVSYDQAMLIASEKKLDLMLVAPDANPPVAKLIDYSKEIYKLQKKIKKQKAKQKNLEIKDITFGIKTQKHDLETKARKAKNFLEKGHKVKVTLALFGREMMYQDMVKNKIDDFVNMCNADYEQTIKKEGNRFKAIIKNKK